MPSLVQNKKMKTQKAHTVIHMHHLHHHFAVEYLCRKYWRPKRNNEFIVKGLQVSAGLFPFYATAENGNRQKTGDRSLKDVPTNSPLEGGWGDVKNQKS